MKVFWRQGGRLDVDTDLGLLPQPLKIQNSAPMNYTIFPPQHLASFNAIL